MPLLEDRDPYPVPATEPANYADELVEDLSIEPATESIADHPIDRVDL